MRRSRKRTVCERGEGSMRDAPSRSDPSSQTADPEAEPDALCCASCRGRLTNPGPVEGPSEGSQDFLLCHGCRDRVRRDLASLPGLYDECQELLENVPGRQLHERT